VTAYVLNLVIVWAALRWASLVGACWVRRGPSHYESSQSGLAAIAVTFIRRGVMSALTR